MTLTLRVLSLNEQPLIQPVIAQFGPQGGTIGRAEHNTLALPDPERHISRQQAQVCVTDHGFCIVNVGSANPIAVGGRSVGRGESAPLRHGDRLIIGGYLLEVCDDTRAPVDGPTLLRRDAQPATRRHLPGMRARPRLPDTLSDTTLSEGHLPGLQGWASSPPPYRGGRPGGLRWRDDEVVEGALATLTDVVADPRLPDDRPVDTRRPGGRVDEARPTGHAPVITGSLAAGRADGHDAPGWPEPAAPDAHGCQDRGQGAGEREVATVPATLEAVLHQCADTHNSGPASLQPEAVWASPVIQPLEAATAGRWPDSGWPLPDRAAADRHVPTLEPAQALPSPGVPRLTNSPAELWRAFCDGAGLEPGAVPQMSPEAMLRMGRLLRACIAGCLELLAQRGDVPARPPRPGAADAVRRSNPLAYAPDASFALKRLLAPPLRGFLDGPEAVNEAMHELIGHAAGLEAGRQAALESALQRFAPTELGQALAERAPPGGVTPINQQARLWELYLQHFESLRAEARDTYQQAFGQAFLRAYEQQLERWERDQSAA